MCLQLLRADLFTQFGPERGYAFLFNMINGFWNHYRKIPPPAAIYAELNKFIQANPQFLGQDAVNEIQSIVYWVYTPGIVTDEYVQQYSSWIRSLAHDFFVERSLTNQLRSAIDSPDLKTPELIRRMYEDLNASQRVFVEPSVDAFDSPLNKVLKLTPTGCKWFDLLSGGGFYPHGGHVCGFIAPTGVGKTMAAVDLSVQMALSNRNVAYFTYELPVRGDMSHELTYRVIANSIGYSKDLLEDHGYAGMPDNFKTRYLQMREQLYGKIMFFDFGQNNGMDSSKQNNNSLSVINEVESHIRWCCDTGRPPTMVVIDYFDMLRDRAMIGTRSLGNIGATTATVQLLVNELIRLASKYSTNFFCLFQASNKVCAQPYWVDPAADDAADVKGNSRNMQLVISATNPQVTNAGKDDERVLMRFKAVKDRLGKGKGMIVVERKGAIQKFITHEHLVFDSSAKSFYDSSVPVSQRMYEVDEQ